MRRAYPLPFRRHRMGEREWSSVGEGIQPLLMLREPGLAVPSPVGRERVTCLPRRLRRRQGVRVGLFEMRLLSVAYHCTNPFGISGLGFLLAFVI